ncbi:MAG TPA: hypothetical protein VIR33_08350 [Thermopolyspora sp.]
MASRPFRWEPVRLSAAAFLTVQMSISGLMAPGSAGYASSRPSVKDPIRAFQPSSVAGAPWKTTDRRPERHHRRHRSAAMRLAHRQAAHELRTAGIRRRSTGHCTSRRHPTCTSLGGIRAGTVDQMIRLKRLSHCPIVITGGTETGHSPGRYSHAKGYKLDIAHNRCLDAYIRRHYRPHGVRGDGARLYRSGDRRPWNADVLAREWNHWDIMFR